MRLARRPWAVLAFFGILVVASRYPLIPDQLFTFDDVNLAYSIGHYDIRISQPHPPGYPLFVLEMRVLWWLRFRHVEHILMVLTLAGSVAAIGLLGMAGSRILGGASGVWAAWMMIFHPVFWHAGVTSALRIQLAVVSLAVAAACWRAWSGDGRWVLWSAVALGLGAGIRPETGLLLFPLWAAGAWRAPVSWRERRVALAFMAGAVALWLLPAMIASGGPVAFVKACLDYITDQASVSSGLFGASDDRWSTTFWRTTVWVFCGLPGMILPAVLAWRRREWWGLGWERAAFLALWFVPAFGFAILVHIEDPGHALTMVPVVSLLGGYLMSRAIDETALCVSRWHAATMVGAALALAWMIDRHGNARFLVTWVPPLCLATGLALKLAQTRNTGYPPRSQVVTVLLLPALALDLIMFLHLGWYYKGSSTSGWQATGEQVLADLNSGLALTSLAQIRSTVALDDHTLREIRRLAAERPGDTVVVWEHGPTAWRKAAYYAPSVPIMVLEHRRIQSGSPPVVAVWKGPVMRKRAQGPAPLGVPLPAGARIVWVLNPRTEFYEQARQCFALTAAEPVWYTDLPRESGSRTVGEYQLIW